MTYIATVVVILYFEGLGFLTAGRAARHGWSAIPLISGWVSSVVLNTGKQESSAPL